MLKTKNRLMVMLAMMLFMMTKMMVVMIMTKKMMKMMMMVVVVVLGAGECEGQAESGETCRTNVTPSDNLQCAVHQCYTI